MCLGLVDALPGRYQEALTRNAAHCFPVLVVDLHGGVLVRQRDDLADEFAGWIRSSSSLFIVASASAQRSDSIA